VPTFARKASCKNACENLDPMICSMLFAANTAVEQEVIETAITITLFAFTRF